MYEPDDISKSSINRTYLISVSLFNLYLQVLACVRKDIYLSLYNEYKSIIANRSSNKWDNYVVEISNEMTKKINTFVSSEE